jgi:hypothetical protein
MLLAAVLILMAVLVASIYPPRAHLTPAPLIVRPPGCLMLRHEFIPSNITEVPWQAVNSLPAAARNRVIFQLNMTACTCGCLESIFSCRMANPRCQPARKLARQEVAEASGP